MKFGLVWLFCFTGDKLPYVVEGCDFCFEGSSCFYCKLLLISAEVASFAYELVGAAAGVCSRLVA